MIPQSFIADLLNRVDIVDVVGRYVQLKKGGVAWLSGSAVPGGMMIEAILTPKLLRALR